MADFRKMELSELIAYAEMQMRIEQGNPSEPDPDRVASWAETFAILQYMQKHGVPDAFRDKPQR